MHSGVLAGYPVVDVRAILTYGSYHDVDSSEMAFKIAGSICFKKAARLATPILLEPIMSVEVVTPTTTWVTSSGIFPPRGRSRAWSSRATHRLCGPKCPGRDVRLRYRPAVAHSGRATYTMQFNSYQEVPASVSQEIVARVRGE